MNPNGWNNAGAALAPLILWTSLPRLAFIDWFGIALSDARSEKTITDNELWERAQPAKIGSISNSVLLDKRIALKIGRVIRRREVMHGSKWETAKVTKIYDNGYFFADCR